MPHPVRVQRVRGRPAGFTDEPDKYPDSGNGTGPRKKCDIVRTVNQRAARQRYVLNRCKLAQELDTASAEVIPQLML